MILLYFFYRIFIDVIVYVNGFVIFLINMVLRCSFNVYLNLLNSFVVFLKYLLYIVLIYIYFVNLIIKKKIESILLN